LRDQGGGFDQPVDVHDAGEGASRGVGRDEHPASLGTDDAGLLHGAAITKGQLEESVAGEVQRGAGTARELNPAQAGGNHPTVDHARADERGQPGVGDGDATGVADLGAGGPGGEDELTGVKPGAVRIQRDGGEAAGLDHAGSADEHAVRIGHHEGPIGLDLAVQPSGQPSRDAGEQQGGRGRLQDRESLADGHVEGAEIGGGARRLLSQGHRRTVALGGERTGTDRRIRGQSDGLGGEQQRGQGEERLSGQAHGDKGQKRACREAK